MSNFPSEENKHSLSPNQSNTFDLLKTSEDINLMNEIFKEFKDDKGHFDIKRFKETLNETGRYSNNSDVKSQCKILQKKLANLKVSSITYKHFQELFTLDWKDVNQF